MNVNEYLWNLLDNNVNNVVNNELKVAVVNEWQKITQDITQKLVDLMPNMLQVLVKIKDYHTEY